MAYKSPKIKPSHVGLFSEKARKAGMSVRQYADKVTAPNSGSNKATKSQAQFYKNFNK